MKRDFKPVSNQRSIGVNKLKCDQENLYAKINIEALNQAMRNLRPAAFDLWIYFAQNQDKYSFYLSCVDACRTCGFGKTAYHKAFDELVDKFYLVRDRNNRTHYEFYELPHEDPSEERLEVKINKA